MRASNAVLLLAVVSLLVIGDLAAAGSLRAQDAPEDRPLRPGDLVELSSWREADIPGEYTVDEDGYVVLPHLGRVEVAGRPAGELRQDILDRYAESFRGDRGIVQVSLQRRVRLFGEVGSPGLYHVDRSMSLGDLIAEAGGVTGDGDEGRIRIARGQGSVLDVELDSESAVSEVLHSGDQITVREKRWFRRHFSLMFGGVSSSVFALAMREYLRRR